MWLWMVSILLMMQDGASLAELGEVRLRLSTDIGRWGGLSSQQSPSQCVSHSDTFGTHAGKANRTPTPLTGELGISHNAENGLNALGWRSKKAGGVTDSSLHQCGQSAVGMGL